VWRIRETIPEACLRAGVVFKYDLSLPVAKFYEPTTAMRDRLKAKFPNVISCGFGHLGDGTVRTGSKSQTGRRLTPGGTPHACFGRRRQPALERGVERILLRSLQRDRAVYLRVHLYDVFAFSVTWMHAPDNGRIPTFCVTLRLAQRRTAAPSQRSTAWA